MARKSNTKARRAQIVNALHSLLGELGYDGASVSAIAKRAELAPGLVHYHFGNKEEILLAVVVRLAEQLRARQETLLGESRGVDPWRDLDAWIDAHLALGDGADPSSVAAWVAIGAEALRKPAVRAAYEAAVARDLDRGEELVAAVLAARADVTTPARTLATGILAAIEGSYRLAAAAPSAIEPGFAAPTVRAMARGLLGNAG